MARELLRTVRLSPYRRGMGPRFTLTMWDTCQYRPDGRSTIAYRLVQTGGVVLFEGADYYPSQFETIDSDDCVAGLLSFLTLRPGDTDSEWFANYTPAQLEFCDQHAEALACEAMTRFSLDETAPQAKRRA